MNVAHPKKLVLAAVAAFLAQFPVGTARAADPAPAPGRTVVVGETTSGETRVILVEQIPKKPWDTPEWAYPDRGLTFFPEGPGKGKDRWAVGALWQIAPMFTASYARGLGSGFSVDARVQTIILYNQLMGGAGWAAKVGPFSLGVMAHVGVYFGALGKALIATTSFDTTGWGVLIDPGAKAGIQVSKDAWLTLQYEAYLIPYQAVNLGGLVLSPGQGAYGGFGLSAIMEYAPNKQKGVIYYGVSLYNTASNYPIFFNVEATPTSESFNNNKIWYLGLLAGYEF